MLVCWCLCVAAVIGFALQAYEVVEGISENVSIDIQVLSGELGRSVLITIFTADGSAYGMYFVHMHLQLL